MTPRIFSARRRQAARAAWHRSPPGDRWLTTLMADELLDRLDAVTIPICDVLAIGSEGMRFKAALAARGASVTTCDLAGNADIFAAEDALPLDPGAFDLVLACGTLDSVNDLPGALIQIRRVLRPGGLLLGAMMGAGSLPLLRQCLADEGDPARHVARMHPQVDVRAAGDLLVRSGYAMAVADQQDVTASFATIDRLTADLRANGLRSTLADHHMMTRAEAGRIRRAFDTACAGTRATESFCPIYFTGWNPAVGEPLARGPQGKWTPAG